MSAPAWHRCTICRDTGLATVFWLEHRDGRRINMLDVDEYSRAKEAGYFDRYQPSSSRCQCAPTPTDTPRGKARDF